MYITYPVTVFSGMDARAMDGCIENRGKLPKPASKETDSPYKGFCLIPPSTGISEHCRKSASGAMSGSSVFGFASESSNLSQTDGYLYHSLKLKSAYHMDYRTRQSYAESEGDDLDRRNCTEYEYMTTHHDRASCTVDYVFFNESPGFQLISTSPIPKIDSMPKIPNKNYGSDHFAVAATFSLLAEEKFYKF